MNKEILNKIEELLTNNCSFGYINDRLKEIKQLLQVEKENKAEMLEVLIKLTKVLPPDTWPKTREKVLKGRKAVEKATGMTWEEIINE